jgi:hypothetical protein
MLIRTELMIFIIILSLAYKKVGLLLYGHGLLFLILFSNVLSDDLLEPIFIFFIDLVLLDYLIAALFKIIIVRDHALRREADHPIGVPTTEILRSCGTLGTFHSETDYLLLFLVLVQVIWG